MEDDRSGEAGGEAVDVAHQAPIRLGNAAHASQTMPASPTITPLSPTVSKQDVFTLEEGPVVLQWPASLSPDSFEDLSGWWEIMLRKIKRSVAERGEAGEDE